MTTVENTTALVSTVIEAGPGGIITARDGYEYVVGQDDSGNWTLTSRETGTYTDAPLSTFDQTLNWRVVNEDEVETQSRADFFRSLPEGAILTMIGSSTRFIWIDRSRDDNGNNVFRLVDERWGDLLSFNAEEAENENDWQRVGEEVATPNTLRHIAMLLATRRENQGLTKSLDEVSAKLDRVIGDFNTVNEKLCEYGIERGYCEDFEYRISQWNEELNELELFGRPRQFTVGLRIAGMDDSPVFMVYPQARSEKEAREQVSKLGTRAILQQMLENNSYFDGLNFTIDGTEDDGYED